MTKAILFDFWGTLVENGTRSPIKQVQDILKIELPFSEYVVRLEKAMMTSSFVDLKEAFTAAAKEFDITPSPEQMDQLIGLWNKSWMLAQPYGEVEKMLPLLAEKYQLILVSNTDAFSLTRVLDKFKMEGYFSKKYLSYEEGLLKGKELLEKIMKENNLSVEDCVLVGDSLDSDIGAAKSAGMKVILMDRRERRQFQPKIKSLREVEKFL